MVLNYYNLREQPFGVTPDPRYLYFGPTHREAVASLAYGIQSGRGIMSLMASPGMGKTTVLNHLLEQFKSSARIVCLSRAIPHPEDVLRIVLRNLGEEGESSDFVLMDARLNELLLAEAKQGRKVILVIDEAQNLDEPALEQVRLLSNFETGTEKLIQIILAGQPQLREKLASPHLLQLRQRLSIMARLEPLNAQETLLYIAQRLRAAGHESTDPLFTSGAEALIAKSSAGIPRNINNICFNALSLGYVLKQNPIEQDAVKEVLIDLELGEAAMDVHPAPESPSLPDRFELTGSLAPGAFSAWPKVAATCALLLVTLFGALLLAPGELRKVEARVSRAARTSSPNQPLPPATLPAKAESPTEAPVKDGASETLRQPTFSPLSKGPATAIVKEDKNPRKPLNLSLNSSTAPGKLWEQVKKQDSNAEVALARMYLDGTDVPQNCQQAQVLLLAASKKGNARAVDLLNHYSDKCH